MLNNSLNFHFRKFNYVFKTNHLYDCDFNTDKSNANDKCKLYLCYCKQREEVEI